MTTVFNNIVDPSGAAIEKAYVEIQLVSGDFDDPDARVGYVDPSEQVIIHKVALTTDPDGRWSTNLIPNDDIIVDSMATPNPSWYHVIERPRGGSNHEYDIVVPQDLATPVPLWVGDLMI